MRKFVTGALAAITFAGAVSAAGVASAQYHRNYRHHDNSGAAVAAGIAGLAVGAAIASSGNRGYYGNGYYDRGYYDRGYYAPGYGYGYGYDYAPRRCRSYTVWDPYYREYVQHRRCW